MDIPNDKTEEQQRIAMLQAENFELKAMLQWFMDQHLLNIHQRFHASSERTPIEQGNLFTQQTPAPSPPEEPIAADEPVQSIVRKFKGQRKHKIRNLPIEEIIHDIPDEKKICTRCGNGLHNMSRQTRREYRYKPATLTVVDHHYLNYGCRACEECEIHPPVVATPQPVTAFPNGLGSPSIVAHVITQKYVEAMPLYRQQQSFKRMGVSLSRQTMSNWVIAGSEWLDRIYKRMKHFLLDADILHADETVLQVLRESGRKAETQSYMWLYRTGRDRTPIIMFEYQPTRQRLHPKSFLNKFKGYLHVDGYDGYDKIANITLVGCFAHVRRKFMDALKIVPKQVQKQGKTLTHMALAFCNKLFRIEREIRDLTPEERYRARQERSKPVLDAFRVWLEWANCEVLPKTHLGVAIRYTLNQWVKVTAFLDDGRLEIDNNRSERSIKQFVIGRKNWLFNITAHGAKAGAIIYSIIETAKENGLNPYAYLSYLFEQIPNIGAKDVVALDQLLPWSDAVQGMCRVLET